MSTIATRLLGAAAEWIAKQLNPHIPVNEGIAAALVLHLTLKGKGTETPPGSPAEGDAYIVGETPTGDWSGFSENNVAFFHNGAWQELTAIDNLTLSADDGSGGTKLWRFKAATPAWEEITLSSSDVVLKDTTTTLSVGYAHTVHDAGTKSSGTFTPDEASGAMQKCVNGGAFTLAPPTNDTSILLKITNNASAGTITTSGFTIVTGDAFTTTNADAFLCTLNKIDGSSHLHVTALQ